MPYRTEGTRAVDIAVDGTATSIRVDGQRMPSGSVEAFSLSQIPDEPPHLVLHVADHGDMRFEGLARVAVADMPAPGPAAVAFLAAIDSVELEQAALARLDLGSGPHSLTQAMLDQLREWADGV